MASATCSSVTDSVSCSKWAGFGSSCVASPWMAAVGHHSWAVALRLALAMSAQQTVTWP